MSVTNSSSVSTSSRITALRIKGLAVKGLQICGRFINGGCDETGTKYFYSVWKEDKNVHFFFLFEITMFTAVPNWCHPTNFWASNSRSIFKCSSMSLKLSWLMNGIIFFRSVEMFSPHTKRCHLFDFFFIFKASFKNGNWFLFYFCCFYCPLYFNCTWFCGPDTKGMQRETSPVT